MIGPLDDIVAVAVLLRASAQRERFVGSPTLRIDGRDVDPGAQTREDYGLKCRLYAAAAGTVHHPPEDWVTNALGRAGRS